MKDFMFILYSNSIFRLHVRDHDSGIVLYSDFIIYIQKILLAHWIDWFLYLITTLAVTLHA